MIYYECNNDEVFLKELISPTKKECYHCHGKFRACNLLKKSKNTIALLDKDPGDPQHRYLKGLQKIYNYEELKLEILYDRKRDNKIILLIPKLEDWILRVARKVNVNPKNFNKLPSDPDELKEIINLKLNDFKNFLQAIKEKNPEEFEVLKRELRGR